MRAVILDNEAVQALRDETHRKHPQVVAHLAGIVHRRRRGHDVSALTATTVRVEAGWDRSDRAAAAINRFRIADHVLDGSAADRAAAIRNSLDVSVADAHIGAAVRDLPHDEVVVLTSDPDDLRAVAPDRKVRIVRV